MTLTAFGRAKQYPDGLTIQQWMEEEEVENQEIALVQVNDKDIPQWEYHAFVLRDGDRLQLLYFLGDS